jgi:hypothetical protein
MLPCNKFYGQLLQGLDLAGFKSTFQGLFDFFWVKWFNNQTGQEKNHLPLYKLYL